MPMRPTPYMLLQQAAALLVLLLCGACSDDSPAASPEAFSVCLSDGSTEAIVAREAAWGSVDVVVSGTAPGQPVRVQADADWIALQSDTLPADGIIAFCLTANEGEQRRQTLLTLQGAGEGQVAHIALTQLSRADADQNGTSARDCLYLGYGYDIFQSLDDPMSVRTLHAVLDYDRLLQSGDWLSYEVVHECRLSRTEMTYHNTLSLSMFSQELTAQQSQTDMSISGCMRNCDLAASCCQESDLIEQNYGYCSMVKSVAAKVIDEGALLDLRQRGRLPFTYEFQDALNKLKRLSGSDRQKAIQDILRRFGTHIVMQTDLGGRIDYTFTMRKSTHTRTDEEMQQEADYTLGRISAKERDAGLQHTPSSSKSFKGAINIKGGSPTWRSRLQHQVSALSASAQLSPDDLTDWLATINYEESPGRSPNLDVVHFELMPLWNLVDGSLRQEFINATLALASRSDCSLSDRFLGIDLYKIPVEELDLCAFGSGADATLCRLLYLKSGQQTCPILSVCEEYVPAIRTDARVHVVYPIVDGQMRMNRGVFLGDGLHQPAYVGFSAGDCVVNPIDTLPAGRTLHTLYYINGNLHLSNLGLAIPDVRTLSHRVTDDCLCLRSLDDVLHRYPIVKIGSACWTRRDMDHEMRFTYYPDDDNDDDFLDRFYGGVLFTRFQAEVGFWYRYANDWTYGYAPVTTLEGQPNTLWYLPTPDAVRALHAFLGFNPKALFPGQVSGFDARFNGYAGTQDILQGNRPFSPYEIRQREQGHLNILCTKNSDAWDDACLMVLDDRYNLYQYSDADAGTDWRANYYPVRLTRGAFFRFPSLETINKNVN